MHVTPIIKSIILSFLTYIVVSFLNLSVIRFFPDYITIGTFISFLIGGLLNYYFYLNIVFRSHTRSKLIFIIYWIYIPIFCLLQSKILEYLYSSTLMIHMKLGSFIITAFTVVICYPISYIFMLFLSKYSFYLDQK